MLSSIRLLVQAQLVRQPMTPQGMKPVLRDLPVMLLMRLKLQTRQSQLMP